MRGRFAGLDDTSKKARKGTTVQDVPPDPIKKITKKGVFSHGLSRAAPDITDKIEQI